MDIPSWEYRLWKGKAQELDSEGAGGRHSSGYAAPMDEVFDEWGSYGWELVGFAPCGPEEREYIFKRPTKAPYFEPLDIEKELPSFKPASSSN